VKQFEWSGAKLEKQNNGGQNDEEESFYHFAPHHFAYFPSFCSTRA
jgi:hypothetical protein